MAYVGWSLLLGALATSSAWGAGITYHGRLLRPDGTPVLSTSVEFKLQIRSPGMENCLLYEETQRKDLSASNGMFAITLNDGSAQPPFRNDLLPLDLALQNRGDYHFAPGICVGSLNYKPGATDDRKLVVQFDDGSGWETVPAQILGHVPMVIESMTVGGFRADSLLRVMDPSGEPLANVPALTQAEHNTLMAVINGTAPLQAGQVGNGLITDAMINSVSGSKVSGDIAGKSSGFNGNLTGDVTGTQAATVVGKIQGQPVSNAAPVSGQALVWNGSQWQAATVSGGGGAVTNTATLASGKIWIGDVGAKAQEQTVSGDATISASGVLSLKATGAVGTYTKVTTDAQGRVVSGAGLAAGDLPNLDWSKITTGKPTTLAGYGITDAVTNAGATPSVQTGTDVSKPAFGTAGRIYVASDTNKIYRDTGSAWVIVGTSSAADLSGTLPSSGLPALTGDVTMAAGTNSVTLNTVPISKGGTGQTTATAALNALLPSQGLQAGKVLQTDGTNVSWAAASGGSVSSVGVSVPGYMTSSGGPVTASGTIALSFNSQSARQVFAAPTGASGAPTFRNLNILDIFSTVGGLSFLNTTPACTAGRALSYVSGTDRMECVDVVTSATVNSALGYTPANGSNYVAKTGDTMSGALNLPANGLVVGTNQLVASGGNVGIGTTGPLATLHLNNNSSAVPGGALSGGLLHLSGADGLSPTAVVDGFGNYPALIFRRAANTAAAPQTLGPSSTLMQIGGRGYDGTSYASANQAQIGFFTESTWSASNHDTRISFQTTPTGSTTAAERMRIDQAGNVGIGTTTPTSRLQVAGGVQIGADGAACAAGKAGTLRYNAGNVEYCDGATWSAFGVSGGGTTLSGDVSGANTATSVDAIKGKSVVPAAYSAGQVLRYSGSNWVNASIDLSTDVTGTLPLARGGTGAATQSAAINNLLPSQASNANKVLQTDGMNVSWVDAPATGITTLTGDVTASGTGSVAATIAGNAVTSAKILDGTIVGADLDFTGVNTATSAFVLKDNTGKFSNFACSTTGHVPVWTVAGFACQAPSITETDPKIGANTTNYLSRWNGTALVSSGVIESAGRVGIGTAIPGETLDVNGNINLPTTTASVGILKVNSVPTLHSYGTNNLFLGAFAGNFGLTGSANVGVGKNALVGLSSGSQNVALGMNALNVTSTGIMNSGLGHGALAQNTSGSYNSGAGAFALNSSATGNYNSAFGAQALLNSTGSHNSAMGNGALYTLTTGDSNAAVGSNALVNIATGASNVALGGMAGSSLVSGSSNILIGYNVQAPTTTSSSSLNIGNTIYGNLSSGSVGIGTAAPSAKLHVNGQILGGYASGTTASISWANANVYTTSVAAPATLAFTAGTMFDGGNYTLVLTGTAGTYTLGTAGDISTWKCSPACPSNQLATTGQTVLTILKVGTTGYVSWISGFQ